MGSFEEIVPGVSRVGGGGWGVEGFTPLTESGGNVYLLSLPEANVMVDCGAGESRRQIEDNLRAAGVPPDRLTDLLLTHSHVDHALDAHHWQSAYGLTVHLNGVGAVFLAKSDHRLVAHYIMGPEAAFEPFRVDHPTDDGETFRLGGVDIDCHHLPGHTPDSTLYALNLDGRRIGISGDVTFCPREPGLGEIGWLSLTWLSSLTDYRSSLVRLKEVEFDLLLPGHGRPISGAAAIEDAVRLSLETVDRLLANADVRHFGIT